MASTVGGSQVVAQLQIQQPSPSVVSVESVPSPMLNENGLVVEHTAEGDWSYDPNEPRYCTCNQVSYGDMVACDNEHVSMHIIHSVLIITNCGNCFF